jgi:hypothetical protein
LKSALYAAKAQNIGTYSDWDMGWKNAPLVKHSAGGYIAGYYIQRIVDDEEKS